MAAKKHVVEVRFAANAHFPERWRSVWISDDPTNAEAERAFAQEVYKKAPEDTRIAHRHLRRGE